MRSDDLRKMLSYVICTPTQRRVLEEAMTLLDQAEEQEKPTIETLFSKTTTKASQGADVALSFRCPVPISSKNAKQMRLINGRRGRQIPIMFRPREVLECTRAIQAAAIDALRRQAPKAFGERRPMLADDDVRMEIVHYVHMDCVDVLVRSAGPKRRGVTGRKRDVTNIPELICDALQRIAYTNDNQVSDLRTWRDAETREFYGADSARMQRP